MCAGLQPQIGLQSSYASSILVIRSIKGFILSKKVYHIPLQKLLVFIKENKSQLTTLLTNPKSLEYHKLLGKGYYTLEIERFIAFFKIDKNINYALNTLAHFNSQEFIEQIFLHLNFEAFEARDKKDVFYAFVYLLAQKDKALLEVFFHATFLHYHSTFNHSQNMSIDYQSLSKTIIKANNQTLRESFGEEGKEAFFKLYVDEEIQVSQRGKSIKTLRKKAYKLLLFSLI